MAKLAFTGEVEIDELAAHISALVPELNSVADEIRGYTERIEAAIAGERLFYTETEAAELLGLSRLTLQRMRLEGKVPFKYVGRKPVYTRRHLEQFLSS